LRGGYLNTSRDQFLTTAGIVQMRLTSDEINLLTSGHGTLAIFETASLAPPPVLAENPDGIMAYVDQRAVRLEHGQSFEVRLWVRRFGLPLVGARVSLSLVHSPMKARPDRVNNVPEDALAFSQTVTTDNKGQAIVSVR
jgi:hypothetical protein